MIQRHFPRLFSFLQRKSSQNLLLLCRRRWPERSRRVHQERLRSTRLNDHIWFASMIDIHKAQRHDHLRCIRTQDAGDGEFACPGGITSREIKGLRTDMPGPPFQMDKNNTPK